MQTTSRNALLDLLAPAFAVQLWITSFTGWPSWPFATLFWALLGFSAAIWRVGNGGRVIPAAAAAAAMVMGMMWHYGVIAFVLLMGLGSVAVYWLHGRMRKARPPAR